MSVINIYDSAEARRTILRRAAVGGPGDARRACSTASSASSASGISAGGGRQPHPARCPQRGATRPWSSGRSGSTATATRPFEVPAARVAGGVRAADREERAALDFAAERIAAFHRKQPMGSWIDAGPDGTLGQLIRPLDRAGVYVPGGTAPLPSSLLMSAIPARVAGVGTVIVCTPPEPSRARSTT